MNLRYSFTPDKGPAKVVDLELDSETMSLTAPAGTPPDWAKLEHKKCADCPLKEADSPYCPVAVRLAPLVATFTNDISYDEAEVVVEISDRTYRKRAPMEIGVSGLFGLVMAASGCPILDKLRPMVFTHTPFPSMRETMYRSMSMYLLGQYFVAKKGGAADWTMEGLTAIYEKIGRVNRGFSARLRPEVGEDATLNAVVNLDCFATFTVTAINRTPMAWLENLFKPYWSKP